MAQAGAGRGPAEPLLCDSSLWPHHLYVLLKQITQREVEGGDAVIVKDPEMSHQMRDTTPGS